jgi:hypothetical protein
MFISLIKRHLRCVSQSRIPKTLSEDYKIKILFKEYQDFFFFFTMLTFAMMEQKEWQLESRK